jgi:hypothetical protein
MTYRLTSAQRCVLADCTRTALVGWLVTDPAVEGKARRIQYKATGILGFGFSRFVMMAVTEFGADYRPGSVLPGVHFPLSLAEAAALANDIELEMATDGQLHAAGVIAAHSLYGQPEVCSRDWRTYTSMLVALGLSMDDYQPTWREDVRDRLRPFRRAVAAAAVSDPAAAE